MQHLQPSDLTLCYNNEDGTASAGSYTLNSVFLNQGKSPIVTIMSMQGGDKNKKENKVSERLRDLAVPAGLLYMKNIHPVSQPLLENEDKGIVDKSLYNKLVELVSYSEKNKTKSRRRSYNEGRGTRKNK